MAKGKSALMVQGMGVGMRVLQELTTKLEERGGNEELLHLVTKPRFAGNLDKIVDAIMACDWKIPASEMQDLAEKAWLDGCSIDGEYQREFVRSFCWLFALTNLGMEFQHFRNDSPGEELSVPKWYRDELKEKKLEFPLFVSDDAVDDKKFLVVDLQFQGDDPDFGELIGTREITTLYLIEAKYFDFTK